MDKPWESPRDLQKLVRRACFLESPLLKPEHHPKAELYRLSERWHVGERAVLVLGTFDGVHKGHQYLINQAKSQASKAGLPLVIVTFDPDPALVLAESVAAHVILSTKDRLRGLASLAPDALVVFPFTKAFAKLGFEEFFCQWLFAIVEPQEIHVGAGFSLGHQCQGTPKAMESYLAKRGCSLWVHDLLIQEHKPISATRIRQALSGGNVSEAQRLLGRYPFLPGLVIHGRGEGASFGFPTANVAVNEVYAFSRRGVFAGLALEGSSAWPCAINMGNPLSFATSKAPSHAFLAEASLLGFEGDLYDCPLILVIVAYLRDARTFETLKALKKTVLHNLGQVAALLGDTRVEVA